MLEKNSMLNLRYDYERSNEAKKRVAKILKIKKHQKIIMNLMQEKLMNHENGAQNNRISRIKKMK